MVIISIVACSAKRDGFLGAPDLPYRPLPGENPGSEYVLAPKDAAEDEILFVKIPFPRPSFIGAPPEVYTETIQHNKKQSVQSVSLGYSTQKRPAILIRPIFAEDIDDIQLALKNEGFIAEPEAGLFRKEESTAANLEAFEARIRTGENIILVHLDGLAPTGKPGKPGKSKRRKKKEAATAKLITENGFELLNKVRDHYIGLQ